MSETRYRTEKGQMPSRTVWRNRGPRVPEQLAQAIAEKAEADATTAAKGKPAKERKTTK